MRDELGLAVVWIEHAVRRPPERASSACWCCTRGRKIADGAPSAVARNPGVIEAYLGDGDGGGSAVSAALKVTGLSAGYGGFRILDGLDLDLAAGRITAIVGPNGAGKTHAAEGAGGPAAARRPRARSTAASCRPGSATAAVRAGLILVAEGRHLFPRMTVPENLELGGWLLAKRERAVRLERALALFPRLGERRHQLAGSMSGGEQQMVALARALIGRPRLLMLDEPSLGLAPRLVDEVLAIVRRIRDEDVTVLLIEQNVAKALAIADDALRARARPSGGQRAGGGGC